MLKAKFVEEITVFDPDSKGDVDISIFKHDGGGMFAIDSSYIVQVLPEEGQIFIQDPLNEEGLIELLGC